MKVIALPPVLLLMLSSLCFTQKYWEGSEYISDGVRQPLIIHHSKEEAKILKDRWQAIGDEIRSTDSVLAGDYEKSGYRGWYLRWSPKNGFVYIFHYEDIDVIDYSYGKVEINGTEVTLTPEREMETNFRESPLITPKSWIVMGSNIIPKYQIKDFADYLSGLGKYNNWNCDCMAFFRKSHYSRAEINSPNFIIPRKFKHLFRPPIEGKILFVGKSKLVRKPNFIPQVVTPLQVGVGKRHGIRKGMLLRLFIDEYTVREIEINRVYDNYSFGTITDGVDAEKSLIPTYYDSETGKERPFPPIRIGTTVTTKLYL